MKELIKYFLLGCLVIALIGGIMETCEDSKHDSDDVEYFLSKGYSVESVAEFARNALTREDYSAAHKCIDYIKNKGWLHRDELYDLKIDVYSEEIKYLLSSDPDNSMVKIKVLLSDLAPTVAKPSIGTDVSSSGDDGWDNYQEYKGAAVAYNAVLGKLVDLLLALDMKEEAKEFANKGLEIPIQDTENERISGYSAEDAKAIADKVLQ